MHIAPCTGDRCFKETGAGLLKVLMCDCITNACYLMIILVNGDSLDIKELAHLLQTLVYIYVHKATTYGYEIRQIFVLCVYIFIKINTYQTSI